MGTAMASKKNVTAASASGAGRGPQEEIILCLGRIRVRLWLVRVMERSAVALAWGGVVGVMLTTAWLLRVRFAGWATVVALVPVALGALAWMYAMKLEKKSRVLGIGGVSAGLARVGAVATAVLAVGMTAAVWGATGAGAVPAWGIMVAAAVVFVVLAVGSVRMIDARSAAIFVDQQVGLNERVATALELLEQPAASALEAAFRAPVIASAVGACQRVKTAKVAYGRMDGRVYAVAATVAIAAVAVSLMTPLPAQARTVKKMSPVIVTNAKNLQEVLKEMEQKRLPNDKVTADKLKPLEQALGQLKQGDMSAIESSAMLDQAKREMQRDKEQTEASDKVQQMLKKMEQTQDFAQANDPMKDAHMQEAQGNANAGSQKAAAEKGINDAAKGMADKMRGGQMSDKDKKDLADGLNKAAKQAAGDPQLQKDLQDAADAAKSGDADKMQQSMQAAGDRMGEQRANQAMSQDSVNRAMAEIDRMQGNSGGTQSTMGQSADGNPGSQGNQGNQGNQGQNGEGQNGENQGGQQGGQGQQASSGQGQEGTQAGGQAGPGQGGGQPGQGSEASSMMENRGGPGDQHEGGPIGRKESFVRIYDQRTTETNGTTEKVGSHINPLGGPAAGTTEVMGNADKTDATIRTYADELPAARQKMMDELDRQEIPPQYQDLVREFYAK